MACLISAVLNRGSAYAENCGGSFSWMCRFVECEICKLQATVDKEDSVWKSENNVQRKIYEVGSIKSKRFS